MEENAKVNIGDLQSLWAAAWNKLSEEAVALEAAVNASRARIEAQSKQEAELGERVDQYRNSIALGQRAIDAAQAEAKEIRAVARLEADRIVREATAHAKELVMSAELAARDIAQNAEEDWQKRQRELEALKVDIDASRGMAEMLRQELAETKALIKELARMVE